MTIVSHAFKRARFLDLHLPALRWSSPASSSSLFSPESSLNTTTVNTNNDDIDGEQISKYETKVDDERHRVRFIGIDPPPTITSPESLHEGECQNGHGLWKVDPYGKGPALSAKRACRDPWGTTARFLDSLVELKHQFGRDSDDADGVRAKGVQAEEEGGEEGRLQLEFEVNNLLVWKGPILLPWELPWTESRDQRIP